GGFYTFGWGMRAPRPAALLPTPVGSRSDSVNNALGRREFVISSQERRAGSSPASGFGRCGVTGSALKPNTHTTPVQLSASTPVEAPAREWGNMTKLFETRKHGTPAMR